MEMVFSLIVNTAFVWVPVLAGTIFWHYWMEWRQGMYLSNQKWTLLEISIPKDIHKSPEAMEIIFNTLNDPSGVGTHWKKYWVGAVPHEFSLEIISVEGSIYFFIRTQTKFKELIKNQIYSQYPAAEVNEVDDYTRYVGDYAEHEGSWKLFGLEFILTNDDAFPIKTYVDYGLDKAVGTLEEEQKIDPITPQLEFLGSLRKNEQVWLQMIIRSDKWSSWRKDAVQKIGELMGRPKKPQPKGNRQAVSDEIGFMFSGKHPDAKGESPEVSMYKVTHGEQEQMKAIERSLSKPGFEVGFRALYLARDGAFRPSNIAGMIGSVRQYNSANLNGFRPGPKTDFDYKYQDMSGNRLTSLKKKFFNNYVQRAFFNGAELDRAEKEKTPFVLTSEELATMFRFPGRVSTTATLERIEATKSEAPTNLPI